MTRSLLLARSAEPSWASSPPRVRSAGADYVRMAESAGLVLDDWQVLVLDEALGERADGSWASFEVGLCCPRQNGKSAILEALMLGSLFLDGGLTIYSAHEFKTASELYRRVRGLVDSTPDLSVLVKRRVTSTNEMGLELHDGSRLRFLARSGGSGRGFSGDRLIFDEAMILSAASMGAMLPTLSARPNPQVWYAGSAGMADSDHWRAVRDRGRAGSSGRLTWLEWGCEDVPDPTDRALWAAANPSLGVRLHEDVIEAEFGSLGLSPDTLPVWLRERLGVWDEPAVDLGLSVADWLGCADPGSEIVGPVSLALDVSKSFWSALAVSGLRGDGLRHVEVIQWERGTGWVPGRVAELVARWSLPGVVVDPFGPVKGLLQELDAAGVTVLPASSAEVSQACVGFARDVSESRLRHLGDTVLDESVRGASRRPLGDAWAWSRKNSAVDISPLVAATLALWAASESVAEPSVYVV